MKAGRRRVKCLIVTFGNLLGVAASERVGGQALRKLTGPRLMREMERPLKAVIM